MSILVVGISDCKVSGDPRNALLTYALGSCIAIAVHDPVARIAGLLHFMLPDSSIDRIKATRNPFMFADTGISKLLKETIQWGAVRRRLVARVAGGAQILDPHDLFQIGRQNYLAARRLLWQENLLVRSEAVGGGVSRTMRIDVQTGETWIREAGVERLMLDTAQEGIANDVQSLGRR